MTETRSCEDSSCGTGSAMGAVRMITYWITAHGKTDRNLARHAQGRVRFPLEGSQEVGHGRPSFSRYGRESRDPGSARAESLLRGREQRLVWSAHPFERRRRGDLAPC